MKKSNYDSMFKQDTVSFIQMTNYLKKNDVNMIYELNAQGKFTLMVRRKLFKKAMILYCKGKTIDHKIFSILIDKNVNLDAKITLKNKRKEILSDNYPLHISVGKNDIDLTKVLLDNNTNINVKNPDGRNCLFQLFNEDKQEDNLPICSLLLERGINTTDYDNNGLTPLMEGVNRNCEIIVERLLLCKGNINAFNYKDGNTVLHYAIYKSNINLVQMILDYRPDMTIRNLINDTPLDLAMKLGNESIVKIISLYTTITKTTGIERNVIMNMKDFNVIKEKKSMIEIPFEFTENEERKVEEEHKMYSVINIKNPPTLYIDLSTDCNIDQLINEGLNIDNNIQLNIIKEKNDVMNELSTQNELLLKELNKLKEDDSFTSKEYESLKLYEENYWKECTSELHSLQLSIDKQETLHQILILKCLQLNKHQCSINHTSEAQPNCLKSFDCLTKKYNSSFYTISYVHEMLTRDIQDYVFMINKEIILKQKMISNLLENLKDMANSIYKGLNVDIYGSYATQTSFNWSDIDIIITPTHQSNLNHETFIQSLFIKLQSQPWLYTANINEMSPDYATMTIETNTQCDSIKIQLKSTNYDNQEKAHVNMIMNFMAEYTSLRPLLLIAKALLKHRRLNSAYQGGINGYNLTLLVIYFLQNHDDDKEEKDLGYFDKEEYSLGKLFMEFMDYYSIKRFDFSKAIVYIKRYPNDYMSNEIINDCKKDKEQRTSGAYVIDPLNHDNNVAYNTYQIEEMQELFDILSHIAFLNCDCSCHYINGKYSFNYEDIDHCILSKMIKTAKKINKASSLSDKMELYHL